MPEIKNRQTLLDRFGRWPSFHDAEIVSALLQREEAGASLTLRIHTWDMSSEVDSSGFFILTKHTLVTLRFDGVVLEMLRHFNHQNVLSALLIEEVGPDTSALPAESNYFPEDTTGLRFDVTLASSYGCEGRFLCRAIEVVAVEDFLPA